MEVVERCESSKQNVCVPAFVCAVCINNSNRVTGAVTAL